MSSDVLIPAAEQKTCFQTTTVHDRDDVNSQFEREVCGPELGAQDLSEFEVSIPKTDPAHPQSWSIWRRWYITSIMGLLVMNTAFASSLPTGQTAGLMQYFAFSQEVATLLISIFVAGYSVGPLLWAPMSEQFGRKPIFVGTFIAYVCFQVGCALSKNTASILIFRLLGGIFAAAPLSNAGAVISDIWDASNRGKALTIFTLAPFAGPVLAPICSGWMAVAGVSWRWSFWLLALFAGVCFALIVFTIPETYVPILTFVWRKKGARKQATNAYWASLEKNKLPMQERIQATLGRPFKIVILEPMLFAISLYMSFAYGCIYLLFEAYPIVFREGHHFNAGVSSLMFVPLFLGGLISVFAYLLVLNPRYERKVAAYAPHPVPPEARLETAMWGAPLFAVSFFWFGWTSFPRVSYWAPMLAGFPLGWGTIWIFLPLFTYVVDAYLIAAASARRMYDTLDPRWASTLLGFIAVLMCPIPFVLQRFGPVLRRRSRYAPTKPPPPKDSEPQAGAA